MRTTTLKAHVLASGADAKAADHGLSAGQFKARVSVTNVVDSYGDVITTGAFGEDLDRWKASGDLMPVVWAHDWADPFAHIGFVTEAIEDAEGLLVTGQLDIDDNPKAAQVWRLLKARRITQFSFAFDVLDGGWGDRDGVEVYEIRKVKVHEVGPCLVGVNQETDLIAAKAQRLLDAKAGRVLSQKNYDALQEAYDAIGAVLKAAQPVEDEKATTGPDATPTASGAPAPADGDPEPSQAAAAPPETPNGDSKSQVPSRAPRRALAIATIINL